MDPVTLALLGSTALSGGMSLFGGLSGQSNQAGINAANIAAARQFAQNRIQWTVADANKAGINPLAALGSSYPSAPVSVGSDALPSAMNAIGQDVSRAAGAYMDAQSKQDALGQELVKAQINRTNAETTGQMLQNSKLSRTLASPGSPPTIMANVPLPRPAPWTAGTKPLYEKYRDGRGGVVTLLSHDASQSVMNAASLPVAPVVGTGLISENVPNLVEAVRPDIARAVSGIGSYLPGYSPDPGVVVP